MFFVYADCKSDGTPFYIGKGNYSRLKDRNRKNKDHAAIREKTPDWYRGVIFMGSEADALQKEKQYIAQYRPILTNKTAGGQGITGLKHSDAAKAAVSAANKGRKWSIEARQKMSQQRKGVPSPLKGVPLSPEHKAKVVSVNIGRVKSEETKKKIAASQIGVKKPHKQYLCVECGYISSSQHVNRHQSAQSHVGKEKL